MSSADPYAPFSPEAATDEPSTAGDLRRVRTGVSLVFYGLMLWVLCMLAAVPQAMVLAVVPALGFVVMAFFALLQFGSAAMAFVGRIFCLSAPEQERRDQAERALLVLKLGAAAIIAIVGLFVGMLIELPALYLPCGMLLLPLVLAQLIYYALLLWDLKNILQSRSPSASLA